MLCNLVAKLKSQSLDGENGSNENDEKSMIEETKDEENKDEKQSLKSAIGTTVRKSARIRARQRINSTSMPTNRPVPISNTSKCPFEMDRDSGTESDDDDELGRIETASTTSAQTSHTSDLYTSQQSLSLSTSCRSPSLPIGDHDANSWESMGCESGIIMRESDTDSNPTASELLYQRNRYLTALKQQQLLQQQMIINNNSGPVTRRAANNQGNWGAFRPVGQPSELDNSVIMTTLVIDEELANDEQQQQQQQYSQMNVGDKRKLMESRAKLRFCNGEVHSATYGVKLRSSNISLLHNPLTRDTLTAARRTPVRLLIPPPLSTLPTIPLTPPYCFSYSSSFSSFSLSMAPSRSKRTKIDTKELRPSLNFDKMRERMMTPDISRENKFGKAKAKVQTPWACHHRCPKNVNCIQSDCMFRPVEPANDNDHQQFQSANKSPTDDLLAVDFRRPLSSCSSISD